MRLGQPTYCLVAYIVHKICKNFLLRKCETGGEVGQLYQVKLVYVVLFVPSVMSMCHGYGGTEQGLSPAHRHWAIITDSGTNKQRFAKGPIVLQIAVGMIFTFVKF